MEGCIILFGESFRLGGQRSRNRGSDESYADQMKAAESQMAFIQHLNSKNVNIKVYISSYKTNFDNDLLNIYKDVLIGHDFYENLIGQGNLIHNAINKIPVEKYDFLLIMRIDLFLKSKFTEIFNQTWDKIMWPSVCFKPYHKCGIHPRVNDTMIFIPRKYYGYIKNLRYSDWACEGHDQWKHFIENTDLTSACLDTMLNTFHDSDSAKDWNPIYRIVNRNECQIHHDAGDVFDKWMI